MKSTTRAFIAVNISSGVRKAAMKITQPLQRAFPRVKWVDDANFHVTLKFLGSNVPTNELHRIIRAMERARAGFEQFDLVFSGVGAFPDSSNPRTVWIGVTDGVDELKALAERIDDELALLGFPRENRAFSPHLTIGRARERDREEDASGKMAQMIQNNADVYIGCSPVDSIVLYSSELQRGGAKYEPIAEVELTPFGTELRDRYGFNENEEPDDDFYPEDLDDAQNDEIFKEDLGTHLPEKIDAHFNVEELDAEVEEELRSICGSSFAKKKKKFNPQPVGNKPDRKAQQARLNAIKGETTESDELDSELSQFGVFREIQKESNKSKSSKSPKSPKKRK